MAIDWARKRLSYAEMFAECFPKNQIGRICEFVLAIEIPRYASDFRKTIAALPAILQS
jgi:hypothetical protein